MKIIATKDKIMNNCNIKSIISNYNIIYLFDFVTILIIVSVMIIYSKKYLFSGISFDEQAFLWQGWNIIKGEIPYRDFSEIKPPVIFFMNALSIILFGLENMKFKIMPLILIYPSIVIFYLTLRRLRVNILLGFIISIHIVFIIFNPSFHDGVINDTETYGLVFSLVGFSLICWNINNVKKKLYIRNIFGGIFLALSVLSKEPFLLVVISILLTTYYFYIINKRKYIYYYYLNIFIGIIIPFLLTILYLISNNAILYYYDSLKSSLLYAGSYAKDLGLYPYRSFIGTIIYDIKKLYENYYNLDLLLILIPYYIAFYYKYKISYFSIINIVGILIGCYGISIGHCFWKHYYLIGTMGLLLPAIYGSIYLSKLFNKLKLTNILLLIICIQMIFITINQNINNIITDFRQKHAKIEYEIPFQLKTIVYKHTTTEDYILVTEEPILYVYLNRKHSLKTAVFFDELIIYYKGNTFEEKFNNVRLELEERKPKVIYIPANGILKPRQQKYFNYVIYPIIKKYNYTNIDNSIYYLN